MTFLTKYNSMILITDSQLSMITAAGQFFTRQHLVSVGYFLTEEGGKYDLREDIADPSHYYLLKSSVKFDAFTGQNYATERSFQGKIFEVKGDRLLIEFTRKLGGKNKIQLWCSRINFIFTPRGVKLVGLSQLRELRGYETTMI